MKIGVVVALVPCCAAVHLPTEQCQGLFAVAKNLEDAPRAMYKVLTNVEAMSEAQDTLQKMHANVGRSLTMGMECIAQAQRERQFPAAPYAKLLYAFKASQDIINVVLQNIQAKIKTYKTIRREVSNADVLTYITAAMNDGEKKFIIPQSVYSRTLRQAIHDKKYMRIFSKRKTRSSLGRTLATILTGLSDILAEV